MTRSISESRFVIAYSGFADGPAQPLRDHLLARGAAELTTIAHPLVAEGPHHHEIRRWVGGTETATTVALPNRPPFTYPLDLVVPWRVPSCDVWFGFNGLAVARGLARRARHRATQVVTWNVDFVPDRFGRSPITRVYDAFDRLAATRADRRVELSEAARDGRAARLGLDPGRAAPTSIIPMGAWTSRSPVIADANFTERLAVYMGHLVPRQGVLTFVRALGRLRERGAGVRGLIIGDGPQRDEIAGEVDRLGLRDHIELAGFVDDQRDVERLLARGAVAVAPYADDPESFTRYADPGKLKLYAAAGLPIVVTPVPPTAALLAARGVARVVADDPVAIADAITAWLDDRAGWAAGRAASLAYAREFDWGNLLDRLLGELGYA